MQLLTFAHRPEAAAFFPQASWRPVKDIPAELFAIDDDTHLLITGEGIQSATVSAATALTHLGHRCREVLNFGVVGALKSDLDHLQVYKVRSVYGQGFPSPLVYHTFRSQDENTEVDCLSARERVLNEDIRRPLSAFADLVDRELWGIASVCHQFNVPWSSLKVISDQADDPDRCAVVRTEAQKYSELLWKAYQAQTTRASIDQQNSEDSLEDLSPSKDEDALHFTKSQEDLRQKLLHMIGTRTQTKTQQVWQNALQQSKQKHSEKWQNVRPKERSRLCIETLNSLAYPERTRFWDQMNTALSQLNHGQFETKVLENLEEPRLRIEGPLLNEGDLNSWRKLLAKPEWAEVCQIINGTRKQGPHDVS